MLRKLTACVLALGMLSVAARAAEPAKPAKVLFVTQSKGFVHGSVRREKGELAPAEIAMTQLGQDTGLFTVHCTQECEADFTKENLAKYDIVMFYTTGELPISDDARDYFSNEWLKQEGHGVIGFHSATDTFGQDKPEHKWYQEIIGGSFNGHPWGSNNTVTISVHDTKFPAMQPFGEEFQIKDEIYQYKHWVPENVHVLMSLNMAKCDPKQPYHVPVAWARMWGNGKIFYNNLGHNAQTWTDPRFLKSTEHAVRWVLNLEEAAATPNPELSAEQEAKAKQDAGK